MIVAMGFWIWGVYGIAESERLMKEQQVELTTEANRKERQARHEQGLGLLARSAFCEENKDFLSAKLMAMKAMGFAQFRKGKVPKSEELLLPGSKEFELAMQRILNMPEVNVLYANQLDIPIQNVRESDSDLFDTRPQSAQCVFSGGSNVSIVTFGGLRTDHDLRTGEIVSSHHQNTQSQIELTKKIKLDRRLNGVAKNEIVLTNGVIGRIDNSSSGTHVVWLDPLESHQGEECCSFYR